MRASSGGHKDPSLGALHEIGRGYLEGRGRRRV
jgi:hypothetical protein